MKFDRSLRIGCPFVGLTALWLQRALPFDPPKMPDTLVDGHAFEQDMAVLVGKAVLAPGEDTELALARFLA